MCPSIACVGETTAEFAVTVTSFEPEDFSITAEIVPAWLSVGEQSTINITASEPTFFRVRPYPTSHPSTAEPARIPAYLLATDINDSRVHFALYIPTIQRVNHLRC